MNTVPYPKLRWKVNKSYHALLSPAILLQLIGQAHLEEHHTVRTLPSRKVHYLKPSSSEIPSLYLKEYLMPTFFDKVKATFRSPAEKEQRIAQELTQKKVPTFLVLAVGERRSFGILTRAYLITKSIDRAQSLKDYLQRYHCSHSEQDDSERERFITSLAQFVKSLHQRGVLHRDFHWENILVGKDAQGSLCFYLMDLHRATIKTRLATRERIRNLASLYTGFYHTIEEKEYLQFLKAYAEGDSYFEHHCSRHATLIKEKTEKMMTFQWWKRGKRCTRENKYFAPIAPGSYKGFISRNFDEPGLLAILHNPDHPFSQPTSRVLKDSTTTSSCVFLCEAGRSPLKIHIKRYNFQNIFYALKYLFRTSRGKKVWKVSNALAVRAIPTARPIAFLEQRRGRLLIKSFFISENISHSTTLPTRLSQAHSTSPTELSMIKQRLLPQTAELVEKMHTRGVRHGDLKAANILVQHEPGTKEKLYVLDLDSTVIKRKLNEDDRLRDLSRLNASLLDSKVVSTTNRLRFLKHYLNIQNSRDQKVRRYWKAILNLTEEKLQKSGRRFT